MSHRDDLHQFDQCIAMLRAMIQTGEYDCICEYTKSDRKLVVQLTKKAPKKGNAQA